MAVYTEVSDDLLQTFVHSYGLGELLSYKGIAEGVENTNYFVQTEKGPFILTLYEKRVRSEDLPFFLGLMEHLAARGLSCPTPVRDKEGRILRTLADRPAVLIEFLEGLWVRRPQKKHCYELGKSLASFHKLGADFELKRENSLSVSSWDPLYRSFSDRADEIAENLHQIIEAELNQLNLAWPEQLPQGIIHADLFPDNVFFLGDKISGLIDFYFACNDILAYDIAICLNAWCFEQDNSFNISKARALLQGYQTIRELDHDELENLPLLARGAALRFLLTRSYDWLNVQADALVKPKDPKEYLRKLNFHKTVKSVREYGLGDSI